MALSDGRACKNSFFEIPRKITGVLYEKNKLSETIQRHKGDAVVYPMLIDEITIVRFCLSS